MKLRLAATLISLSIACVAGAQSTEADIAARLVGKPLLLRGFWMDDKLSYNADGTPKTKYKVGTFTLAAMNVTSVKLSGDLLYIEGQRVGLVFDKDGKVSRLPLLLKARGKTPERISMEVDGGVGTGYGTALDAIFANDLADLTPSLPSYWQAYAVSHFLHPEQSQPAGVPAHPDDHVTHIGGSVKPPRLTRSVDPSFTEAARQRRINRSVTVYLWVEKDGTPSHLRVVRPVGLGLDEQALGAVVQYKFDPATQDGNPVRVDIYIDVNFQVF